MVTVRVPATTANLGPGFDTLGMALDLFNYILMEERAHGLDIKADGEGGKIVSRTETNLVYQAAQRIFDLCGYKPQGLYIRLINQIPFARGLGSSAAAVVGGLVGANSIVGNQVPVKELVQIATKIEGHPDNVVPALLGGIAVSAEISDEVIYRKIEPPSNLKIVVAVPKFSLTTREAREILPQFVTVKDAVFNLSRAGLMVIALMERDLDLFGKVMDDRLHQPYRSCLIPGMDEVVIAAKAAGALGCVLSGAGPTLIAFAEERCRQIANAMSDTFIKHGVDCSVRELAPSSLGAELVA
ncbi:MAG: homoserine kinase [Syntrophomonadaceae bacterium]|nr:homoserine kinase [Syntrophomonadaceae bacterium]